MVRNIEINDFKKVIKLVDDTFKPRESMQQLFPYLFTTDQKFSYVQEIDNEIVSFVGVSPIKYKEYFGVSIGAVCTNSEYQGQGLMRKMFPIVISDLKKQNIDFILISGKGKVYIENNAKEFGYFKEVKVVESLFNEQLNLTKYKENIQDLTKIYKIIDNSDNFDYGFSELAVYLESQPVARLTGFVPHIYYSGKEFIVYAIKENKAKIIEHTGDTTIILEIIKHLNSVHQIEECTIIINEREFLANEYEVTQISNSGTIISLNESLNVNELPYCSGLKFI